MKLEMKETATEFLFFVNNEPAARIKKQTDRFDSFVFHEGDVVAVSYTHLDVYKRQVFKYMRLEIFWIRLFIVLLCWMHSLVRLRQ